MTTGRRIAAEVAGGARKRSHTPAVTSVLARATLHRDGWAPGPGQERDSAWPCQEFQRPA